MKRPRETDMAVPRVMPLPPRPDDVEEESLSHDGRYISYKFKFIYGFIPRIYLELPPRYQRPMRCIHKGSYDDICMAVDSNTGEDVAIKKLRRVFDIDPTRPLREIQILRHMNHKNVIVLRDVIPPPRRETFDDVYIVYELMQNDLEEKILTDGALTNERCQLIASLNQDDMEYLNEIAMRYCNRNLPQPLSFRVRFPMVNDKALDLVERMLAFKPTQRITVEDALAHPYLAPLRGTGDESICRKPFKDKSGQQNFSVEEMKELVYRKALSFNPNQQQ